MPEAISNTSPLLYLYRIQALNWLPQLFDDIWIPSAVALELAAGQKQGYDVPRPKRYPWLRVVEPGVTSLDWQALDLGLGEIAAMSLALEHPAKIVLLDDMLARQAAQSAGLRVWGTLKILLEAKSQGLTTAIKPLVYRLDNAGMWLSEEIVQRVLALADET
ncbi:DUF3368 domain-containing protein [Nodosilinea sp. AN01ver1]|uniref:DUF3368 domain-containing protein n=1 Tax=Nodosilinea sp. AN01ver1 TaxID=3423362 RepID=UPI003D3101F9